MHTIINRTGERIYDYYCLREARQFAIEHKGRVNRLTKTIKI